MAGAAGGFSEEQFREACAELRQPVLAVAGWELLVEAMGISIYRLQDQETGLYKYKGFGVLKDCLPDQLANVCMDLDYRKQWGKCVEVQYVYIRERQELDVEGQKIHVVLAQSTSHPEFPERSGVIRVKQYAQQLALTSDGGNGSKVFMYYFDNLGGEILTRLINWAAKKRIPMFVKDLVKACRNYPGRT